MQNQSGAVSRRLSDPDFAAKVVGRSLVLNLALVALLAAFVAHDAYIWTHPPEPKYIGVDGRGNQFPITPLSSPIMDDTELQAWAVKAVMAPYNINYHDYPEQLNMASRRFLPETWNVWAEHFVSKGNLAAIKKDQLLCYAQPMKAAIIRATKLAGGKLAYDVQFPMVQKCENTRQENNARFMMTALIVRTSGTDTWNKDGVAVAQLVADPF